MQHHISRLLITSALAFGLPAAHALSVNGVLIPQSAVTAALQQAGIPDGPQERQSVTQELITRELFRQEAARDKTLSKRRDVQKAEREARDGVRTQAWLKERIKPATVTEGDIKARYEAIVAGLGEKEYRARVIQVDDEAAARAALARVKGGDDFAKVARTMSTALSKGNGGEMGWLSFKVPVQEGKTQNLPLPLAQAVAALPSGGVSAAPVAWNNRFYLFKMDEVRPTQVPDFETVKPGLQQALQAQATERATAALAASLTAKAKIKP